MSDELMELSIRGMGAALREGRTRAEELFDAVSERYRRLGALLDAYKHWDPERARDQARAADLLLAAGRDAGPLMGLPVSIKDIYGVQGMPTFAGMP